MKYIKNINEFLNPEKETYIKWLNNSIIKEIQKLNIKTSHIENNFLNLSFYINSDNLNDLKIHIKFVFNIINKWKKYTLEKDNIVIVIYNDIFNHEHKSAKFYLQYKTLKIKRIKPNKYVYHQTKKENLNSILVYVLIPKDSSKWIEEDMSLEYPPAIFASNIETPKKYDLFHYGDSDIITIKIDTIKIKNKWFSDLNLNYNGIKIKKNISEKYIMTFEPIPPDAIEVVDISNFNI